ncbi:MAG: C39 family peptidase [Phycisphaerales bacterium]
MMQRGARPGHVFVSAIVCSSLAVASLAIVGCSTTPAPEPEPLVFVPRTHRLLVMDTQPEARLGDGLELRRSVLTPSASAGSGWAVLEPAGSDEAGVSMLTTPTLVAPLRFNELLISWNLDVSDGAGTRVEVQVGDSETNFTSPWLYVGRWGAGAPPENPTTTFDRSIAMRADAAGSSAGSANARLSGKIDVDYFVSEQRFDRVRLRIVAAGARGQSVRVHRLSVLFSDVTGESPVFIAGAPATTEGTRENLPAMFEGEFRIGVPFRSQKTPDEKISGRLCSPTSVSMVLAHAGNAAVVAQVAERAYDADNDIYGNWPRNVQAAFTMGLPGYLTRFSDWSQVERTLRAGQPIIASIQVRPGELRNAPYEKTAGHLIVLEGLTADGDVMVADPAVATAREGQLVYRRDDMTRVWLDRVDGTAYILETPARTAP